MGRCCGICATRGGGVELAAVLALGASEAGEETLVNTSCGHVVAKRVSGEPELGLVADSGGAVAGFGWILLCHHLPSGQSYLSRTQRFWFTGWLTFFKNLSRSFLLNNR